MNETTTTALVTGVGRREGIGFEVCRQLASRGMRVILTARSLEKAAALSEQLAGEGLQVHPVPLDVQDASSIAAAADAIGRQFGRLDVLINNAAGTGGMGQTVENADLDAARAVFEATLMGAWQVTRAVLPLIRASPQGRIVNVSSGAGSHGDPQFGLTVANSMGPAYGIAKAALNALTSLLAKELEGTPIRVNAVCPGFTATFAGAEAMGARPVAAGAAGIIWAATLPDGGPTGGFFRDGKPLPW